MAADLSPKFARLQDAQRCRRTLRRPSAERRSLINPGGRQRRANTVNGTCLAHHAHPTGFRHTSGLWLQDEYI
jgi:hypothetical protein